MAFIASNGLTEAGTSQTIEAGGMMVHYHDLGMGEPVLFLPCIWGAQKHPCATDLFSTQPVRARCR